MARQKTVATLKKIRPGIECWITASIASPTMAIPKTAATTRAWIALAAVSRSTAAIVGSSPA